jgi:DNA (cytosine-5)-methyltransferase 1
MATAYSLWLDELLRVRKESGPKVLDLFAGCGGLALGFEALGFETVGYEKNADACQTYRANLGSVCQQTTLTAATEFPAADIVIGGPPCQPFSVGGYQRGLDDSRDGFPAFISAVQQTRPALWLFENVRGLLYRNRWYLTEITERLIGLGYHVDVQLMNAVQYGVPQNRERLIVVGHQGGYRFPYPVLQQFTAGDAINDCLDEIPADAKFLTPSMDAYVAKYERASKCITPRDLHLEKPSRTLTCRNLAGATGDMMRVVLQDGRRRRLTLREAARLQSFPDWFEFSGGETSIFNQIGNAVPPAFAYVLAKSVQAYLTGSHENSPTMDVNGQLLMNLR